MIISRWPLLCGLLLFTALSQYFFWQIGDDSYIYFRYVEQTLAGFWGQWTPQLAPVEGYSSPLWFMLLLGISHLPLPIDISARLLGLFFSALSLFVSWRLSHQLSGSKKQADLSIFFIALIAGFYYWGTSGLETPLYTFLYTAFAHAIFSQQRSPRIYWSYISGIAAALSLTRPEGIFLLLPLLIISACAASHTYSIKLKAVAVFFIAAFMPLTLWLIFRLSYYGLPLPNTFYAKATGDVIAQISNGFFYSLPILASCIMLGLIFLSNMTRPQAILLALIALPCAFIVGGGGDWMFHFRLWQPILPLLVITLIWQINNLIHNRQFICLSALLICCLPMALLSISASDVISALQLQPLSEKEYQEGQMTQSSIALAKKIQQRYGRDKKLLIAVNHAGALAWALPHANFIDMVGLNDATIAKSKGVLHGKYDVNYVLESLPDIFILNTRIKPNTDNIFYHKGYWSGEDALIGDLRFKQHYQATDLITHWQWNVPWPMSIFYAGHTDSWIVVYEQKNIKIAK